MRCILKKYIEKHTITGSWSEDSGCFDILRDISNKPVGRQGFFENKQPIVDVVQTTSQKPPALYQESLDFLDLADKNKSQTISSKDFKRFFPESTMEPPYKVSALKNFKRPRLKQ